MAQAIPVFFLSLPDAAERRAGIARRHDRLGLAYTIVDGVDGRKLDEAERQAAVAPGVSLTPSEIGCHLSHARAWQAIVDSGAACGLVLEDDAIVAPGFVPLLRRGLASADFDYLFLDVNDHDHSGPIAYDGRDGIDVGRGFRAHTLSKGGEAAHAYIISRAEAQRRLSEAMPMLGPADVYTALPYRPHFRALINRKGAYVSPAGYVSSIGRRSDDLARVPLKALRRYPLFYRVRDWLRGDLRKKQVVVDALVRDGALPPGRDWRAMPSGLHVLFD